MAAADDGTDPPGDEPRRSWLARYESRDRDLVALRRAARTAILMPLLFLLGDLVIGNQTLAMFASFGVFAQALLADISGTRLQRVQGGVALALAGAVLVVLGTLASVNPVVAGLSMAAVAFVVTLVSVVSSTVAGVVPALLLSFILPVSLAGPASSIPSRLSGWLVAGIAALLANVLLWPAPRVEPLRDKAATACRELAAAVVALGTSTDLDERSRLLDRARSAAAAAQRQFVSTPYRPSGVGAEGRALVGLVDQITWITTVVGRSALHPRSTRCCRPLRQRARRSPRCSRRARRSSTTRRATPPSSRAGSRSSTTRCTRSTSRCRTASSPLWSSRAP